MQFSGVFLFRRKYVPISTRFWDMASQKNSVARMRIASYDKNFVCKCIVNNSCSSRSRTKLRIASWWSSRPVLVYGTHRPVCYAQTPLVRFMESWHLEEIYQQVPNMTATNRMPEKQVHGKLYNKSLTNLQQFDDPKWVYDKSTTIQQVEWLESENGRNSMLSGRKCPKMTKKLFPW